MRHAAGARHAREASRDTSIRQKTMAGYDARRTGRCTRESRLWGMRLSPNAACQLGTTKDAGQGRQRLSERGEDGKQNPRRLFRSRCRERVLRSKNLARCSLVADRCALPHSLQPRSPPDPRRPGGRSARSNTQCGIGPPPASGFFDLFFSQSSGAGSLCCPRSVGYGMLALDERRFTRGRVGRRARPWRTTSSGRRWRERCSASGRPPPASAPRRTAV